MLSETLMKISNQKCPNIQAKEKGRRLTKNNNNTSMMKMKKKRLKNQ